jgi:NADH-quinone oxidoreductase subunit C
MEERIGESWIEADRESLKDLLSKLKAQGFDMLVDITAVDLLNHPDSEGKPRFEIVYHLCSVSSGELIRVKVRVEEKEAEVESVVDIWPGADWYEREVWDMFGIRFKGHPNLKRILMYDGFEGHPLRKDFPMDGRQPLIRR